MDEEICDYYEPIGRKDKLCKHFIGDKNKQRDIERCRHYCSVMESKQLMEEGQVFRRVKGALRQNR
jgi:hypothetical protein